MQLGLLSCCVPAAAQRAGPLAAANDWSEKHAIVRQPTGRTVRSAPRAQRTHGDLTRRRLPGAAGSCVRSLVTYSQTAWEETPLLRKLPIASVRYLVAHCGRTASGGEGTSEGARFRKHAARQPYSALVFCALHNAPASRCMFQATDTSTSTRAARSRCARASLLAALRACFAAPDETVAFAAPHNNGHRRGANGQNHASARLRRPFHGARCV